MITNIPNIKLGIIAVSRSCFPKSLSEMRRKAIVKAHGGDIYECPLLSKTKMMQNRQWKML